jgi:hypothetical protein
MEAIFRRLYSFSDRFYQVIALLWLVLILLLSLLSSGVVSSFNILDFVGIDKMGHLTFYSILSLLWFLALRKRKYTAFAINISIIFFGIIMEIAQVLLNAGRMFEWADVLANTIGTLIGFYIFVWSYNKFDQYGNVVH